MCGENKDFWRLLLFGLLFSFVLGALRAEERYYLISETELLSIETLLGTLETGRLESEFQVRELKSESRSLNGQLAEERSQFKKLEQSFNGYEADLLTTISLKNGENAELKKELAAALLDKKEAELETETAKGESRVRFWIIIGLIASWVLYWGIKIYLFIVRRKIVLR